MAPRSARPPTDRRRSSRGTAWRVGVYAAAVAAVLGLAWRLAPSAARPPIDREGSVVAPGVTVPPLRPQAARAREPAVAPRDDGPVRALAGDPVTASRVPWEVDAARVDLVGRVLAPDGSPAAGATVWVGDVVTDPGGAAGGADRARVVRREHVVRADAAGRFELLDVPEGAWLRARSARHGAPSEVLVVGGHGPPVLDGPAEVDGADVEGPGSVAVAGDGPADGAVREVVLRLLPSASGLSVCVHDPAGDTLCGVDVTVGGEDGWHAPALPHGDARWEAPRCGATSSDGCARFDALPVGAVELLVRAPGYLDRLDTVWVHHGSDRHLEVVLEPDPAATWGH